MKRLLNDLGKNTPKEYDRIFEVRKQKGVDEFDLRRWKTLLKHYQGGELMDIGCLDSGIIDLIPDKRKYVGIDTAEEAIKEMNAKNNGAYFVDNLYRIHSDNNFFDYTILGEVIEHLEDPQKAINEAVRITKLGGVIAISTPLNEALEPGAVDHERHVWSFTEEDIRKLLSPYGKVEIETLRSIKEPVYKYCWPQLIAWCRKG